MFEFAVGVTSINSVVGVLQYMLVGGAARRVSARVVIVLLFLRYCSYSFLLPGAVVNTMLLQPSSACV